jgi:hypothetical protein
METKLVDRVSDIISHSLLEDCNQAADIYVLRKVSSALLEDETIQINWRSSGVKITDPKAYPPFQFSNEFSTAEAMKNFCNIHAPVEIVQGFVNKDKDELTFVEGKALAFMICQLYKRFCI